MEIGAWVKMTRDKRGLSQQELAKLSGLSPSFISLIERGERKEITYESVVKLTRALKCNMAEFYKSTQTNNLVVADRPPEEIVKELNASLPVCVPVFETLDSKNIVEYIYIPKYFIGGEKVQGIISNQDFESDIRKGDILLCSKQMRANPGDLILCLEGKEMRILRAADSQDDCFVIVQSVRKFRTKVGT